MGKNRKCYGTYPMWLCKIGRKVIKFLCGSKVEVILRGRGSRKKVLEDNPNLNINKLHQDLPIKYAKKAAVYLVY